MRGAGNDRPTLTTVTSGCTCLPKWKSRRYDEIGRGDVIALAEGLVTEGKPVLANRVQALISSVFSFAVDAGLLEANPVARLRKRGVESRGRRVLSDEELRLFWERAVQAPVSRRVGLALRLLLLTGTRAGEVAGIARSELEHLSAPNRSAWIIPAERSKNRRSHHVPLSGPASEAMIEALSLAGEESEHVFPSPSVTGAPITGHALSVAMARMTTKLTGDDPAVKSWRAEPPTPHDLRRTVATRLASLGTPQEDVAAVLNHVRRDVTGLHYDTYERAREKREALEHWARALAGILGAPTGGAMVLPLRRRK